MAVRTFTTAQKDVYLSEHFTVGDFWSNEKYTKVKLDTTLAGLWEQFYKQFGAKPRLRNLYNGKPGDRYAPVASAGYRDPAIDWTGSRTSQHCYGKGVDMEIPGIPAFRLAQFAETLPQIGGIGFYWYPATEAWNKREHIHIDTRSRQTPSRWGHNGRTSKCAIPTFGGVYKPLKQGHQGWAVCALQRHLNNAGYNCGAEDGELGAKTTAALKAWQGRNGLRGDGIYGRDSNRVLGVFGW